MNRPGRRAVGDCPGWSPGSRMQEWRGFPPAPASWGGGASSRRSSEPAGPETHSHSGPDTRAVAWSQKHAIFDFFFIQNDSCKTNYIAKHITLIWSQWIIQIALQQLIKSRYWNVLTFCLLMWRWSSKSAPTFPIIQLFRLTPSFLNAHQVQTTQHNCYFRLSVCPYVIQSVIFLSLWSQERLEELSSNLAQTSILAQG